MTMHEGHIAIDPPSGVSVWDVDPYDEAVLVAPEPYYADLRAQGPFAYIPSYKVLACGRYEETKEVFGDHERFVSSRGVGLQDFMHGEPWRPPSIVLEVDPPYHTRTRRVIMRALSPKAVAAMKEQFRVDAEALVDRLVEQGTFEAVTDCAEAYPTTVFPKAVGLRDVDPRRLVDYGAMVFNALGPDNAIRQRAMSQAGHIVPWITASCARENLQEGGFGATIYEAAKDEEVTDEEAAMLVRSLLSAGVDTTVTGIGNALWCLATNPEAFEALKADPSLARPCFEEVLRYTSPVHTFCRTAAVDTEVSGVKIKEGSKILCCLGAANLDGDKWDSPDTFRIDRRPMGHLAFGVGVHNCVGQNVARAELDALLTAIAERVDRIELAGDPVWRPNNAVHALDRMPVRFVGR
ncbi:cytochrome P450 [Pelagovum pacificum]|uniref:Cytochrome P450 n=1 Tax=Pelagovum pacificum TaxID=2588711 RepID=A0A5C5GBU4_9RHOB|nr:cytochrome P450 [Pelagovum pacificum]QQA42370.1 cytochrome P450 [Pelagovum pacificum]TNY31454.1 cytochrome P450 [Pelagovum pacificum]